MLVGRKSLSSAGSGGHAPTQELLDFCGEHGIVADVEVLPSAQVGTVLERLARNDVRDHFTPWTCRTCRALPDAYAPEMPATGSGAHHGSAPVSGLCSSLKNPPVGRSVSRA